MRFSDIQAAVFDMDGVLWRGERALDGLAALFDWLHTSGTPYALATNNSSNTPAAYVAKLARLGAPDVPQRAIITSAVATADYLAAQYPAGTRLYVLGMDGLRVALADAGFDLIADDDPQPPQVVVAGIDFALTYDKLKRAALHIRAGADFYGTNGDLTYPDSAGLVPGAGSLLAALQAATDRAPLIIGKPGRPMFDIALRRVSEAHGAPLDAARVLMVGDRLDTDIAGAQAVGMPTALLFTGVTTPDALATSPVWPEVAYEDIPALLRAWAGDAWYRAWVKADRQRRQTAP